MATEQFIKTSLSAAGDEKGSRTTIRDPIASFSGPYAGITQIRLRVRIALDPISADVRQPPVVITLCAV